MLEGNVAPYAKASYTSSWELVAGLNEGAAGLLEVDVTKLGASWGTWSRMGTQRAQLTWEFDVRVDHVAVWWYRDAADAASSGMSPPPEWTLQHLDPDGVTWHDVTLADGIEYLRTSDAWATVEFTPVTTRALRVVVPDVEGVAYRTGSEEITGLGIAHSRTTVVRARPAPAGPSSTRRRRASGVSVRRSPPAPVRCREPAATATNGSW